MRELDGAPLLLRGAGGRTARRGDRKGVHMAVSGNSEEALFLAQAAFFQDGVSSSMADVVLRSSGRRPRALLCDLELLGLIERRRMAPGRARRFVVPAAIREEKVRFLTPGMRERLRQRWYEYMRSLCGQWSSDARSVGARR